MCLHAVSRTIIHLMTRTYETVLAEKNVIYRHANKQQIAFGNAAANLEFVQL